MDEREEFVTDMKGCARCHGDGHGEIRFKRLTHPMETTGETWTHWAICPATGEPIMYRKAETDEVFACRR